ncbi:hypothetical protein K4F52_001248 [Lecanicillium sp. MT-2017a]|nr:hypothetical protein K4F52_001248 [Lecanicillium sp. MT-2017a]
MDPDTLESRLDAQENGHLKWSDTLEMGQDVMSSLTPAPHVTIAGFETSRPEADFFAMSSSLAAEQEPFIGPFVDISGVPTTSALLPDHTPPTPSTGSSRSSIHVTDIMQAELTGFTLS